MKTKVMKISLDTLASSETQKQIHKAYDFLKNGHLVAFPTETVYGLGVRADDEKAIKKLFATKKRPATSPLIIHLPDIDSMYMYIAPLSPIVEERVTCLTNAFWPGPLTIILPKKQHVSDLITANTNNVSMRMPDHPLALALLSICDFPVVAPSANLSGHVSPTTATHVFHDFNGQIPLILDGGQTTVGIESTVIDMTDTTTDTITILRQGAITREDILAKTHIETILAPQQKSKHYQPTAKMILFLGAYAVEEIILQTQKSNKKIGILTSNTHVDRYANLKATVLSLGDENNGYDIAKNLYNAIRTLDEQGVDLIFSESFSTAALADTIFDRLQLAASFHIIDTDQTRGEFL